jgi:hypothetical protein
LKSRRCYALRDFDDELFTKPPNPALVTEDKTLERLDEETSKENTKEKG